MDEQVEKTVSDARGDRRARPDTWSCSPPTTATSSANSGSARARSCPTSRRCAVPLLIRGPGIPAGAGPHRPVHSRSTSRRRSCGPPRRRWTGRSTVSRCSTSRDTATAAGVAAVMTETGPRGVVADLDESGPGLKTKDPGPDALRYSQGIRTAHYLYVEHASNEVELYDMDVDPGQLTNVAGRPAYAADQKALARVLDKMRHCRGGGARLRCRRRSSRRRPARPAAPSLTWCASATSWATVLAGAREGVDDSAVGHRDRYRRNAAPHQ